MKCNKCYKQISNPELLQELAQRIVIGKLKLEKPQDWITKDKTAEEIVQNLKEKMRLCNKEGYALSNISDIYDEKENDNPLNLNYFIAEQKNKKQANEM